MNSILQCFANIGLLTSYLLQNEKYKIILSNKNNCKLTFEYIEILINLWKKKYSCSSFNFQKIFNELNPSSNNTQNNVKNIILFLMETIYKELKKINLDNKLNIISDLFNSIYISRITCINCKKISACNYYCNNMFEFPLNEIIKFKKKNDNTLDIIDCFEFYQRENYMSYENNQMFCRGCNININNIKHSIKIIKGAKVLIIYLDRGIQISDIKLKFKEYLDIKNFINDKESPFYYELIGIITLFDSSPMKFISFCKSFINAEWYKYQDSIVSKSSFEETTYTGLPYALFYSYIQK